MALNKPYVHDIVELKHTLSKKDLRGATMTILIQTGDRGKILIISLYVDDLIFTSNDESMFVKFKNSMKHQFEMSNLVKMKYFLRFYKIQKEGIYIS